MNYLLDNTKKSVINQELLQELYSLPNWVLWKLELDDKGHLDKVPYTIYNKRASTKDPKTWLNYEDLVYFYEKDQKSNDPKFDGIGFVFNNTKGLTFIDLDNCIDSNGENSKQVILDTYEGLGAIAEYSQSGRGIHIITKSKIREFVNNKPAGVEIYYQKRFVALTQNWIYMTGLNYTTAYTENLIKQYSTAKNKKILNITENIIPENEIYRHKFRLREKVKIAMNLINLTHHGHPIEFNDKIYQTRSELEGWIVMQFIVLGYSFEECLGYFEKHNEGTFADEGDKRTAYLRYYWESGLRLFASNRIRRDIYEIIKNYHLVNLNIKRGNNVYSVLKSLLLLAYQFGDWNIDASLNDLWIMSGVSSKIVVRNALIKLENLDVINIVKTERTNHININYKLLQKINIHTSGYMGDNVYVNSLQQNYIFKHLGGSTREIYNQLYLENDTVGGLAEKLNKVSSTISRSIRLLVENNIVIKNKRHYSINPDLDWNKLAEKYNVQLEFDATREIVENERYEQRQRIKEWHYHNGD